MLLPNIELETKAVMINESKDSSAIENIITRHVEAVLSLKSIARRFELSLTEDLEEDTL